MKNFCSHLAMYSFLGWVIEGLHHLVTCGSFKKPNFSWAPFKPMYGVAAVSLLAARKLGRKPFYFASLVLPSAIEFFSGFWLKKRFNLQYWDYSQEKGNVQGLICPKFSFYWSILAGVLVCVVQPIWRKLAGFKSISQLMSLVNTIFVSDIFCNLLRRYYKA